MKDSNYDELALQLQSNSCTIHPSVLHGLVSGLVCSGLVVDGGWQGLIGEEMGEDAHLPGILDSLQVSISEAMQDEELRFEPVLPDGDAIIKARLMAMTGWTQAFLQGFNWAKEELKLKLEKSVEDYIAEIWEIASLNIEDGEEEYDNQSEADYFEVVEFLKVCVLSIYTENVLKRFKEENEKKAKAAEQPSPTIH